MARRSVTRRVRRLGNQHGGATQIDSRAIQQKYDQTIGMIYNGLPDEVSSATKREIHAGLNKIIREVLRVFEEHEPMEVFPAQPFPFAGALREGQQLSVIVDRMIANLTPAQRSAVPVPIQMIWRSYLTYVNFLFNEIQYGEEERTVSYKKRPGTLTFQLQEVQAGGARRRGGRRVRRTRRAKRV